MTSIPPIEPTVAPSDFCPFTKEVAMPEPMPVAGRDASTRVRAALKGGAVTRPVRRNLLELGLAHGQGADALEARAAKADAVQREADGMAGVGATGVDRDTPAEDGGDAKAAEPPDPAAIAAMAGEIREIVRKRDRLAGSSPAAIGRHGPRRPNDQRAIVVISAAQNQAIRLHLSATSQ